MINQRIEELPTDQVDPSIFETLGNLDRKKQELLKIKYSITAYLEGNTNSPNDIRIITKEEFDRYPEANQQQILAHPERYQVIGI